VAISIAGFTDPGLFVVGWLEKTRTVYDLVTTSVYLPKDSMALTLNGTTKWPSSKELQRLERRVWELLPPASGSYSAALATAITDTSKEVRGYMKAH